MKTNGVTLLRNLFLFGLLAAALFMVACGASVPTASAAPTGIVVAPASEPIVVPQDTAPVAEAPVVEAPVVTAPLGNGNGPGAGNGPGQGTPVAPSGELTAAEIADLQYMREEEKLAHDVYLTLYAVWGVPVFDNIAGSEQAHMDSVAYLLDSFGLEDPAAGNAQGVFTNPDLQSLHDQLVNQGSQSLSDALLVGGAIEEIDILDLQRSLGETQNTAVIQVFENLLAGSENHLRAFAINYERQTGQVYQPQYMSQVAYQAIIDATSGRGMGPGTGNLDPGAGLGGPGSSVGRGSGIGQGVPGESRGGPGNGGGNRN